MCHVDSRCLKLDEVAMERSDCNNYDNWDTQFAHLETEESKSHNQVTGGQKCN